MDLSPDGKLVFVTLRGKAPVNGNIKDVNNAVGDVGGFADSLKVRALSR